MSVELENNHKIRMLDAVRERITKFGYRNLRIDDIASDLQISKRTIYETFTSKEEIVREFYGYSHDKFAHEINNSITAMMTLDIKGFLMELRKIWDIIKKHSETLSNGHFVELRTIFPDLSNECTNFENMMKAKFHNVFQRGIELGAIKPSMRSEVFYLLHFHALNGILKHEIISQMNMSMYDVLEGAFSILLTGVLTEDSQREYNLLDEN